MTTPEEYERLAEKYYLGLQEVSSLDPNIPYRALYHATVQDTPKRNPVDDRSIDGCTPEQVAQLLRYNSRVNQLSPTRRMNLTYALRTAGENMSSERGNNTSPLVIANLISYLGSHAQDLDIPNLGPSRRAILNVLFVRKPTSRS